ncbi:MAG: efflux RND transporter periplasmic adaptor subunit [Rhodothalassiaceae bacterium]
MARIRLAIGLGIAVLAGGGAIAWLSGRGEAAAGPAGYETETLERGTIRQIVSATGPVRPVVTVEIGSQLSGQLAEIHVDFNDTVAEGQLLALIDPQTFQTRVAQAEADLAVARASVSVSRANVEKAEATLARAQRDYARSKELAAKGNTSQAALDLALNTLENARADLTIARAQVDNAEAVVKQRAAALKQAEIDLERTEIRSPIDGIVVNRAVSVGQTVAASLSSPILFNLAQDLTTIQIEASIDEADIGGVKAGDPVTFSVDAFPDRQFTGEVAQVRLAATELANVVTYTAVIRAANPGRRLLPGMTASVEIVTGEREDVLRLPNAALRFRPSEQVLAAARSQARADRGGGRGNPLARLTEQLDLSAEQQERLREAAAPAFAQLRAAFQSRGAGADRAVIVQQFRARLDGILAEILTPEQLADYQASQSGEQRRATVWTVGADGALQPLPVILGISDGRFTEVIEGLDAAQPVVTRQARIG